MAEGGRSDQVLMSFSNSDGNLDLYLYNSQGILLDSSVGNNDVETVSLNALEAGEYYIQVAGQFGDTNPLYDITIDAPGAVEDWAEDNDVRAKAYEIELNTFHSGLNIVVGDVDWYQFSITKRPQGDAVVARAVFSRQLGDLELQLYDEAGELVAASGPTAEGAGLTYQGAESGLYYLMVTGGPAGDFLPYALWVKQSIAPTIASFTVSPEPATQGEFLTLLAEGVTDPDGHVQRVEFYLDSDGDPWLDPGSDDLLGIGAESAPGVWSLEMSAAWLLLGQNTIFARAQDNEGGWSTAHQRPPPSSNRVSGCWSVGSCPTPEAERCWSTTLTPRTGMRWMFRWAT